MKVLALDLETSPNLAHVWGLWQQNVSLNQLLDSTEMICWGAMWLGEKKVHFRSVHHDGKQKMLEDIHALLDEADAVMGWNSKGFDTKHLSREFVEAGMLPPAPYTHIDLMLEVRKHFRFPSNKLQYVSGRLGVGSKVQHEGHTLWIKCMAGDEKAWAAMRRYQIQDVLLLPALYEKLKPWLSTANHPNRALIDGVVDGCPKCASTHLQSRGWKHTQVSSYRRFQCRDCGSWSRATSRSNGTGVTA